MTKKDYELIARVISRYSDWIKVKLTEDFCRELRVANPRFDEDKFRKACGFILREDGIWTLPS